MSRTPNEGQNSQDTSEPSRYWRDPAQVDLDGRTLPVDLPKDKKPGEFVSSPIREGHADVGLDSDSRREFLKLMGASIAMMGATACSRRPTERIVPYLNKPAEVTPGIANWYASVCKECDSGCGVLVKSREGRPIKFEGNPNHPVNQGGLCATGQASILNLYDPDRLHGPVEMSRSGAQTNVTWSDLDAKIIEKLKAAKAKGGRIRVLASSGSSPSKNRVVSEFLAGFSGNGSKVVYGAAGTDEIATAAELCYGTRAVPRYRFDRADAIVSFGADFLGSWLSPVEFSKGFAHNRKVGKNSTKAGGKHMSKFFAFEGVVTLTGTNADERYRLKSGDEFKAAATLAHEIIVAQGHSKFAGDSGVRAALTPYAASQTAAALGVPAEAFKAAARELWENRGRGLVVGGGATARGDAGVALEVVVNLLNTALENEGTTVEANGGPSHGSTAELKKLVAEMSSGQVDMLLIAGLNPVYELPKALGFTEALSKVGTVVTFGMLADETASASDFVCTVPHSTESWGDSSPYAGLYSVQQPTIRPLYQSRDLGESLMTWGKALGSSGALTSQPNWHEYVRNNWKETAYRENGKGAPFDTFWETALREGHVGAPAAGHARSFSAGGLRALASVPAAEGESTRLALYPTIALGEGRHSNNSWLQELPDPLTKVTWDNAVLVSPARAKSMSLEAGDVVKLTTASGSVEAPSFPQPGMHDDTVALAIGYGRSKAGKVGTGVGVDVSPLVAIGKQALEYSGLSVKIEKTGRKSPLAMTQHHHDIEGRGEAILHETSLKEYRENPNAGNESEGEPATMWPKHEYTGYRWAMAIDLNSCTGCSACVIACQSENNIPTVGKRFVMDSKEMHWMRIDRYYSGRADQPVTTHQPMLCQQCENAPCETVCPVLATMHDHEGLNQQVYNRCVGTRYCANNCPYKVRRFNWFTFTEVEEPKNLAYNPDISVRTRGVMEKCTFCMQRIREGKDHAKDLGRHVHDGEVKTACQQSCPTDAIIFGNINDKASRVAQIASDSRGYRVLEELNVRPSITYLTKIRNVEGSIE